jgi:outer membrane lipoprotein-sorting protein
MRIIALIIAILLLPFNLALAANKVDQTVVEDLRKQEISLIETYLNNISTLVADFTQVAPDGNVSTGQLFISRPGKLRWQYNPPVPILITINGSLMAHYDYELDQTSFVSPDSNLAGFLTRKKISFGGDVLVKRLEKAVGAIKITIVSKAKPKEGQLTMIFSENPIHLKKLEVVDSSGQQTSVSLLNVKYGLPLDKKLFIIKNPSPLRN